MPPFEIQLLTPFRTKPSPSGSAVVGIAATSEPAPRSESAKAPMLRPSATAGRQARYQHPARAVHIRSVFVQVVHRIRGPALDLVGQHAVALVEERPGEVGAIGHWCAVQLPWNSGGFLPTNARYPRRKSSVCMHSAWAWASASSAASTLMLHSWLSIVLVIIWAKVG